MFRLKVIFRPLQHFRYHMLCPIWDPIVFTIVEYIQLKLSKYVLILFIKCVIYRLCLKIKIIKMFLKFFLNGQNIWQQKYCKGLKMTNFQPKHVALLKNKTDCADVYCVTLIELQAHRDVFIQKVQNMHLYYDHTLYNFPLYTFV